MKQDVQVSVLGIQNAGGEPAAILTRATGIYCFENGVHKINYYELDADGNATENLLFLSQAEMRLSKSGSIAGQFLFIPDRETVTDYRMPFGTGAIPDEQILKLIDMHFDLRPSSIINGLGLDKAIYKQTAAYGHFGRKDLQVPWEWTDKVTVLHNALARMN